MRSAPTVLTLMLLTSLAGCARKPEPVPAPVSTAVPLRAERGGTILTERAENFGIVAFGQGELTEAQMRAAAPRVLGLVAIPSTLAVRVGDTLSLRDALRVVAFDSSGAPLGRLVVYDLRLEPGAARATGPFAVTGERAGNGLLIVTYPRMAWGGRTDARSSVAVPIMVSPRD